MEVQREDHGHQRIATFDIESTHYDASKGEVVSIGIAVHNRDRPLANLDCHLVHRGPNQNEQELVRTAYDHLDSVDADFLVSFNGRSFDFNFIDNRLDLLNTPIDRPKLDTPETHLDLLHDDRKALADNRGAKWPSLEESLAAYGYDGGVQMWRGDELTNTRFGKELGPAYLDAVNGDAQTEADNLRGVIEEYLQDDLLKNVRLYYYDIGHFNE